MKITFNRLKDICYYRPLEQAITPKLVLHFYFYIDLSKLILLPERYKMLLLENIQRLLKFRWLRFSRYSQFSCFPLNVIALCQERRPLFSGSVFLTFLVLLHSGGLRKNQASYLALLHTMKPFWKKRSFRTNIKEGTCKIRLSKGKSLKFQRLRRQTQTASVASLHVGTI